jgi:hypothetical protein
MAAIDVVEKMFNDLNRLVELLKRTGEPSLAVSVSEVASKALLMAAASRFEAEFTSMFTAVARELGAPSIASFAINQGVVRKFHTLFQWDASNVNKFYKLFGDDFKEAAAALEGSDGDFSASIGPFISLGAGRNELAHSDFAAFPLNDTLEELIDKYRRAAHFLPGIRQLLVESAPF